MDEFLDKLNDPWVIFGFSFQALFFMRFLVQWIASERAGRSVVPVSFWIFSLGGACGLFIYAVHRRDPVFMVGQSLGFVIYTRNLMLIHRERLAANAGGARVGSSRSEPATVRDSAPDFEAADDELRRPNPVNAR